MTLSAFAAWGLPPVFAALIYAECRLLAWYDRTHPTADRTAN